MSRRLLAEPFQLMEHIVQTRFAKTNIDPTMVVIMIVTVLLVTQLTKVVTALPFLYDSLGALIIGAFVAGGIALFFQSRRAARQFMQQKIYPVLTGALQPLNGGHYLVIHIAPEHLLVTRGQEALHIKRQQWHFSDKNTLFGALLSV